MTRHLAWATVLIIAMGFASPANATFSCELKPTKDGFVALRQTPGGRLVAKLTPDAAVMLGEARKGNWVEVYAWPNGRNPEEDDFDKRLHGWVSGELLDLCG